MRTHFRPGASCPLNMACSTGAAAFHSSATSVIGNYSQKVECVFIYIADPMIDYAETYGNFLVYSTFWFMEGSPEFASIRQ